MLARPRSAEHRSGSGCWTCRLRRVKCDEGKDLCDQCTRQCIPCEGYSREKPSWKDGGRKESEKLESIKSIILRKRKRDRQEPSKISQPKEISILSGLSTKTSSESMASTNRSPVNTEIATPNFPFDFDCQLFEIASHQALRPPFSQAETSEKAISPTSVREDELLMHYLDYVFTLQFRHHTFAENFSSRSWLLSLVKRITPLRHSVLSLSALHQHYLQAHGVLENCHDDSMNELQDHHASALSELRQFIHDQTSETLTDNHVAILACCVQLISFDLFQGGNKEWRMHLEAANTLIHNHIEFIGPGSSLENQFHQDTASNFYTGAVIWFDILSSATTGKKPVHYSCHQRLLKSRPSLVSLENIMGCENAVMVLISEISVLQEWKVGEQGKGSLSIWALVDKARWILEALEREIERLEICLTNNVAIKSGEVYIITNIYACAALVFLQTVVCGCYPSLPEIRYGVGKTIAAIKGIDENDLGSFARSLVWPAVIAGSLADEDQADFFRSFLTAGSNNAFRFGNCHIAKEVLDTCWEHSKASGSEANEVWNWSRAMQHLGYHVLLV